MELKQTLETQSLCFSWLSGAKYPKFLRNSQEQIGFILQYEYIVSILAGALPLSPCLESPSEGLGAWLSGKSPCKDSPVGKKHLSPNLMS